MEVKKMSFLEKAKERDKKAAESYESVKIAMQFEIAKFVLAQLKKKGMTQKELANQLEMKPSQLNKILHAEKNCTIDTIAKLYFKLGYKATIYHQEVSTTQKPVSQSIYMPKVTYLSNIVNFNWEPYYGEKVNKEIYKEKTFTTTRSVH